MTEAFVTTDDGVRLWTGATGPEDGPAAGALPRRGGLLGHAGTRREDERFEINLEANARVNGDWFLFDRASKVVVPGGHEPWLEFPDAMRAALRAFLGIDTG